MLETIYDWLRFEWLVATSVPIGVALGIFAFVCASSAIKQVWGLYGLIISVAVLPTQNTITIRDDLSLTLVDVVVMALAFVWMLSGSWFRKTTRSPWMVPIASIVVVRFASTFAIPDLFAGSMISWLRYVEWFLVFMIVVDFAQGRPALRLVRFFMWIILAETLVSIAQFTLSQAIGGVYLARGGSLDYRGSILSWLQIVAVLTGLSLSDHATRLRERVGWAIYTLVTMIGLVTTLGRTAWITGALGISAYYWLNQRASKTRKILQIVRVGLVVVVVVRLLLLVGDPFRSLVFSRIGPFSPEGEASWSARVVLWRAGLDMFFEHPMLGVGSGNYADLSPQFLIRGNYASSADEFLVANPSTHNAVINVLSETGVLGFLAYLLFSVRVMLTVVSDAERFKFSELYPFLVGIGSSILVLLLADWYGWTSFFVWSALVLGLYAVLRSEALNRMERPQKTLLSRPKVGQGASPAQDYRPANVRLHRGLSTKEATADRMRS